MQSARLPGVAILLVLASGAAARAQSAPETFVAYADFVAGLASADPDTYLGSPGAHVESRDAFEEMRRHLLWLYQGVAATHSFLLDTQFVDCIPILQQPAVRKLGLTELPPPPRHQGPNDNPQQPLARTPLELGLLDKFGNPIECAPGTIPMRRVTLPDITRFKTLQESFQKGPNGGAATPQASDPYHKYAEAFQNVSNYGAQSVLNVWYPIIDQSKGAQDTISQIWVSGGGGTSYQSAEVGWWVAPYFTRTTNAVLFVYWTANGYNGTGCFNLDCGAFVQTSNIVVLGAPNWPGPSTWGGQQVEFEVEWEFFNGNWWLAHNADANFVGYYPGSIYQGGQMSQYATVVAFGGEAFSQVGVATAWPPMGSGAFASAGASYAAYQRSIAYLDLTYAFHTTGLTRSQTSPACYTVNCTFCLGTFYFGGPGASSCP